MKIMLEHLHDRQKESLTVHPEMCSVNSVKRTN